jgi:hypothetical protein
MAISFCTNISGFRKTSLPNSALIAGDFQLAQQLLLHICMKLWKSDAAASKRHNSSAAHEFVIGPLCDSHLCPGRKARLYYCIRCKERFFVSGTKVAVLGGDGSPLVDKESLRRLSTFGEGPCPVLEAFASAEPFVANGL